ncbi:MAG: hypothetical protein HYS58_01660 [Elusimicrobia bacterium]|nr:hypothetical protein [Elusimicrobiota bacterium]MBI4217750.1 hypothetical protein [Elusimicrobiota bacterium]
MDELKAVWTELESHDWSRPKSLPISNHRVKLYMGAMEIPLVSFQPKESFILSPQKMKEFISILDSLGLELDCVEEGGNYKINRAQDQLYLGRITRESLKLHAIRVRELGWNAFEKIVQFFLHPEGVKVS